MPGSAWGSLIRLQYQDVPRLAAQPCYGAASAACFVIRGAAALDM